MIPHEREMVARLKNKPFQLVSISCDEQITTLKKFLAEVENALDPLVEQGTTGASLTIGM